MKPWFEREAKVIKFPEPEKKVVQMPNVASYPDFITGVSDLKARMSKGDISQASHDKLYTDLIHRFMRKESFETPWFLREARKTDPKVDAIKKKVKNVLQKIKQVKDIADKGNQLWVFIDVPTGNARKYRIEFMKNVAPVITKKLGIDAQYDPRSTSSSSSGFLSIAGTNLKFYAKDAKKQGDDRAGVANELDLVKLIKAEIDKVGEVDVIFKDDKNNTLEIPKANAVGGIGKDTVGRKKGDVVISNGQRTVPISLKKTKAGFYESADTIFGDRAKIIIEKLVKEKKIALNKIKEIVVGDETKPYYKMSHEIVVKPSEQDAIKVLFGSDLNPEGGIIIQDFRPHHFVLKDGKLYIDCYAVIKTLKDVPDAHLMYWLIFSKPRNSRRIGYAGIAAAAVTMTRAFGSKLTKNPIFVDQSGNEIPKPEPRNPQI